MLPTKAFLTRGVGRHKNKLESFEAALRAAGIAPYNLVRVSSIFPKDALFVSRDAGIVMLGEPGSIVYCVMAEEYTNENNRLVGAGNGIALPKERNHFGYISEYHCHGWNRRAIEDHVEDMAVEMLATAQGLELDIDRAWNERRQHYKLEDEVIKARSIVQTARGKEGLYTAVVSAVVFCAY